MAQSDARKGKTKRRQGKELRGTERVDKQWLNWWAFFSDSVCLYYVEREWVAALMVAAHLYFCLPALLISVLCLCVGGSRGRWRRENYAQWDAWRKQFEIEIRATHPPPRPSQNGLQTFSLTLVLSISLCVSLTHTQKRRLLGLF